jgi:hypothetical protein
MSYQDMNPSGTPAQQALLYQGTRAVVAAPLLAFASLANGQTFVTITPALAADSRTINAAKAASSDRPTFCAALAADLNTTGGGTTAYIWTVNGAADGLIGTAKAPGIAYNSIPTGTALVGGVGSLTTTGTDAGANGDRVSAHQPSEGDVSIPLVVYPADGTYAPFEVHHNSYANSGDGSATKNHATFIGYNCGYHSDAPKTPLKIGWFTGLENCWFDPSNSTYGPEWYLEYHTAGDAGYTRPIMVRVTGAEQAAAGNAGNAAKMTFDLGLAGTGEFVITAGGSPNHVIVAYPLAIHMQQKTYFYKDVGMGTTSPNHTAGWINLHLSESSGAEIRMTQTFGGALSGQIQVYGGGMIVGTVDALPVILRTGAVERLRIAQTTGAVTIASLAGTGTRTVVASSTGVLSAP